MPNPPELTMPMPVPASYNDITQNISIYRYVGLTWYQKVFYIYNTAPGWILRFQAACYEAHVWVNGQSAVNHTGGHLPFEADITSFIPSGDQYPKVHVVVSVNNFLTPTTLPPNTNLFYNYGGTDRSILLYSTSKVDIEDITIDTQHVPISATLTYAVTIAGMN